MIYTVGSNVSVTQDGSILSAYSLKINDRVALVVSSGEVTSIEVLDTSASSSQIRATVLVTNTREKTMMVQLSDGTAITVDVSDALFITSGGSSSSLSRLETGDRVELYGQYAGASFAATLVIQL